MADLPPDWKPLVETATAMAEDEQLRQFVRQSNAIERLEDDRDEALYEAMRVLLDSAYAPRVVDLEAFVRTIQRGTRLRGRKGADVYIRLQDGSVFRPPPGGRHIRTSLAILLKQVEKAILTPAEAHAAFESLHPFNDGNGRAGRALWVWQMKRDGLDPYSLPFLHRWYYQSLELSRRALAAP